MKFKRKLLFISSLPLILSATPKLKVEYFFTSTNVLNKLTGDKNVSLKLALRPIEANNFQIISRLYNHATGALLFSNFFSEYVGKKGQTFTVDYPIRYKLTSNGLRFEYEITYGSNKPVTRSGVVYPYLKKTINALQYKDNNYVTENAFIKVDATKVVTGETFNFDNYNEYLAKNNDNSIDFSSVKFYYPQNYAFTYLKAEYHIKDYNNIYPNLRHIDNEVVIDMICTCVDSEITFSIKEEMYVKEDTLEMSTSKLPGYIKTDKLFIPVDKQKLAERNDSYILVNEAGYSAVDIILPLSFYFDKKIIGLCYESDYCFSGGIREWF